MKSADLFLYKMLTSMSRYQQPFSVRFGLHCHHVDARIAARWRRFRPCSPRRADTMLKPGRRCQRQYQFLARYDACDVPWPFSSPRRFIGAAHEVATISQGTRLTAADGRAHAPRIRTERHGNGHSAPSSGTFWPQSAHTPSALTNISA